MSANRFFGASIAAMVVAAVPSAAYAQQTYSFDVPAEKLADSLRAIGARSGTSIAFDPALTRGKKAPAIKGVMGVNQALSTALSGSGLEARTSASGYIVAAHAADLGNAVAGGPNAGNKNPPSSLGESSGAAAVNEKPQESEIIVTGSHIRHAEPLSRIITTTRQQIQTSGYTSIAGYVQNLPQQFPGVSAQYNGLTATSNDADNNDAGSAGFDLRGLGPEATLVLLNGQRTASAVGSNVFDISALPVSLLDRIEILTDGASAIYGSDAVAGVVNIITRRDFVGLETDFDTNVETRTGHAGFGATLLGGFKWNSGNIAASYNHQSSIGLNASDRSFSYASDPRTTLVPAQNSDSGFVTLTQRILPDLILTSDNILSQRRNSQYNGFYDESLANRVAKLGSTEKLSYDFGHDWNASLFGSYSWEKYRDRLIYGFSTSTPFIGHAVQTARYADISPQIGGPLFKLPGGNVRIALGADYRRDSFTMTDSSSTSKQRRHVFAAFGEVLFPFIAPEQGIPGIRRLSLDASDRWDHYSDFGSTNNPKVSAVWSPFLGLEFHGSYGTSFRAPDLTRP